MRGLLRHIAGARGIRRNLLELVDAGSVHIVLARGFPAAPIGKRLAMT